MGKIISDEERIQMLNEARMWTIVAPQVLPLLERRKKSAFEKLLAEYRGGKLNFLPHVAELSTLADLESDIRSKEVILRTLEEKSK